jgi:ketosteroid isomerase-like protein
MILEDFMGTNRLQLAIVSWIGGMALGVAMTVGAAEQTEPASLEEEIAAQDRALFDAYNAHDLERVMSFFSEDLEFYHDTDGLLSRSQVAEGTKSLFGQGNGIRRDLVPDSLRVHPVPGYGAIQLGAHRFCHDENGRQDCGVFQFIHVWRKLEGRWRITRVLSYGHWAGQ